MQNRDEMAKVLHGFMMHERSLAGYIAVLLTIRSILTVAGLAILCIGLCLSSHSNSMFFVCLTVLAAIFAVAATLSIVESKFGRLAIFLRADGKLRPHHRLIPVSICRSR